MQNRLRHHVRCLLATGLLILSTLASADEPRSGLSSPAVLVSSLAVSIPFYRDVLGYEVLEPQLLEKPGSILPFGFAEATAVRSAYLRPIGEFKSSVDGFVLIEPVGQHLAMPTMPRKCETLEHKIGELVLSHNVYGLGVIAERAKAAGFCVVSAIMLSASGRSHQMSILGPDGLIHQLYEYVPDTD